jgi:hypothetical protein
VASSVRLETSSFAYRWDRWVLTVSRLMRRFSAIWGLVRPRRTSATTACSVVVRLSQLVALRHRADLAGRPEATDPRPGRPDRSHSGPAG